MPGDGRGFHADGVPGREHAQVQIDVLPALGGLATAQGDVEPADALESRPGQRGVRARAVGAHLEGEQRQLRWRRGQRVHARFPRVGPGHALVEPRLRAGADLAAGHQPAHQPHVRTPGEPASDPRQPVTVHHHVVVDEGDVLVHRHPHPPVAAAGVPRERFVGVAHPGVGVAQGHVAGLGCDTCVVDHHYLETRVVAGQDGIHRVLEQPAPVAGADHHADRRPGRFRFRDGGRKLLGGPSQIAGPDLPLLDAHRDETAQGLALARQETGLAVVRSAGQFESRIRWCRCQVAKIEFTDPYRTGPLGVVAATHRLFQHYVTLPESRNHPPPAERDIARSNEGDPR